MRSSIVLTAFLFSFASASLNGTAYSQAPKPTDVRVVTSPIANFVALVVGKDKGFFAEENLNVTWSFVNQGAVAVEAVFGGSAELGGAGILEPIIARGNGLDLKLVVPTSKAALSPPHNNALVVRSDSSIKSARDLEGKTVSVGLVNSINHVHFLEWLRRKGVDAKKITVIEVPFPQMPDALLQNRLDMVWAVEPFLTILNKSGKTTQLGNPFSENIPGMDLTAIFAKDSWIKANPDTTARFRRAYIRATNYLNSASKQEKAEWVAKFTNIKPDLIAEIELPVLSSEFNIPTLQENADLAVILKLSKPLDVKTLVWEP
jgi:NitT/TauT family transport system substrate-binding protein